MSDATALGDRMKQQYEVITRYLIPRRTYSIIRVDGRAFHTLLAGVQKPFDPVFSDLMDKVTRALCRETGAVFGYTQSDEASVLLTDFTTINKRPWFGGVVQKMASIAAGTATAEFNFHLRDAIGGGFCVPAESRPAFDARVFTIPDPVEVANYFVWRQFDCYRNSVMMAAQAFFTPAQLHGKNPEQLQEMLWQQEAVNWSKYPEGVRRGRLCVRRTVTSSDRVHTAVHSRIPSPDEIKRRREWIITPAVSFAVTPDGWLARNIPPLPSLENDHSAVTV